MSPTEIIMIVSGSINALIFITSACIAFGVYRWNDRQKKKDRALDLFKTLMNSEFFVKARLVSREYLLEDEKSEKYRKYKGLNFEELDAALQSSDSEEDRQARFYIRALPNFFQTVNLTWRHNYILQDEKIFSEVYAWYWVNIFESRAAGVGSDEMFLEHTWMRADSDVTKARTTRGERLRLLALAPTRAPIAQLPQAPPP